MKKINKVLKYIKLNKSDYELYGDYKAKINVDFNSVNKENGKLILVTAINPTPTGEGKTLTSISLTDSLNKIGSLAIAALREPSMGPVFGRKGGATGSGKASIEPSEDINLHFTGDIHAITSSHNLISAYLDNYIYYNYDNGNPLNLDLNKIVWKRIIDLNDRALRDISYSIKGHEIKNGYQISVASEIMASLCLAESLNDLKERISKMIVAYTLDNKEITVKDLKIIDNVMRLLTEAIKPNLVQTQYGNPVFLHGGPFANIAHGCSSVIATKLALKLADYVVTEAGFGADLGAEKFVNIKCRQANIEPSVIVLVATVKALKYNSGEEIKLNSVEQVFKGSINLIKHIKNLKKFNKPIVVSINKFETDTEEELNVIKEICKKEGVDCAVITSFKDGEKGAISLANIVNRLCMQKENKNRKLKFTYKNKDTIKEKILSVAKNIYGAKNVNFSNVAEEKLNSIKDNNYQICIAKTPYSFSDNPSLLGSPENFEINVTDIKISQGAGFIVVYTNNIITLPGLTKIEYL